MKLAGAVNQLPYKYKVGGAVLTAAGLIFWAGDCNGRRAAKPEELPIDARKILEDTNKQIAEAGNDPVKLKEALKKANEALAKTGLLLDETNTKLAGKIDEFLKQRRALEETESSLADSRKFIRKRNHDFMRIKGQLHILENGGPKAPFLKEIDREKATAKAIDKTLNSSVSVTYPRPGERDIQKSGFVLSDNKNNLYLITSFSGSKESFLGGSKFQVEFNGVKGIHTIAPTKLRHGNNGWLGNNLVVVPLPKEITALLPKDIGLKIRDVREMNIQGESVHMVHSPFGYKFSVGSGIVGSTFQELEVDGETVTTALFSIEADQGSGGAPLTDINGQLNGVILFFRDGAQKLAFGPDNLELAMRLQERIPVMSREEIEFLNLNGIGLHYIE